MSAFISGLWVVLALELRQRVRGIAWYVLLGIFAVVVGVVTAVTWVITIGFGGAEASGGAIYSVIIYFVLLLGTLVAPALSGNAINGDREAGTLATTQVTLITTWQLILGKFFAAWITALAFLVAALPFLIFSLTIGEVGLGSSLRAILVLAIELGVVAAVGVGLSGIFSKPLFSIVVTYLVVAALSIGTLIAFGLAGAATRSPTTHSYSEGITYDESTGEALTCGRPDVVTYDEPRFDLYWGILAANPYVVMADAAGDVHKYGPDDVFGTLKLAARTAQISPELVTVYDECDPSTMDEQGSWDLPREVIDQTVPTWFVGLAIHIALGAAALLGAWRRTNTPARTLSKGSRIA
jgi:ABC-type transport system involved in multi-copper enzyme maturation permease subunit